MVAEGKFGDIMMSIRRCVFCIAVYVGSCMTSSAALGGVQGLVGVKVSVGGTDSALGSVIGLSACDMDTEGSPVGVAVSSDLKPFQSCSHPKLNKRVRGACPRAP
jgi:hypothetical protein